MPRAPKRCVVSPCPKRAVLGGRCPEHQISERYIAAWEGSSRQTSSQAWRILRKQIIQRDGAICQMCGAPDSVQVDHILNKARGGTDDPDNLQILCDTCHSRKSAYEGQVARRMKRAN